ncbi:hypothetical protein [Microaerobacter geothermalis]|uniref:hypothetical protein n=1 Tax=Microaerobacter geothermalis TaxID=674972 RepID=UPI001F33DE24|nr:hypothetical protein [Microaerobacter geothermalis]
MQLWFIEAEIKIENGQGYSVLMDTESEVITILKKDDEFLYFSQESAESDIK